MPHPHPHTQLIINEINYANKERAMENTPRRILKLFEEIGEASEAYLSRTSPHNYKGKTWDDFREECVDIMIVMIDVSLTSFPNSNFPTASLLLLYINEGIENRTTTLVEMEQMIFNTSRAVNAARDAFLSENSMGFYGALSKGIISVAKLCYAKIPKDANRDVEEQVFSLVKKKIEKWTARKSLEIKIVEETDAKAYLRDSRSENQ